MGYLFWWLMSMKTIANFSIHQSKRKMRAYSTIKKLHISCLYSKWKQAAKHTYRKKYYRLTPTFWPYDPCIQSGTVVPYILNLYLAISLLKADLYCLQCTIMNICEWIVNTMLIKVYLPKISIQYMLMKWFIWNSMEGLAKPFFQYEEMRSRRIVALLGDYWQL